MVKLTGIALLKWNGSEQEATMLGMSADLASYGFFQRTPVREMMTFAARTIAKRTVSGQRQSVQQDDFFCHAHNRDGLVGIAFVDKEYPVRSAFCVVSKVMDDYVAIQGTRWRSVSADSTEANSMLEPALAKYQVWQTLESKMLQDPHQADKLAKIQSDLDETKVVLHRTIESMLERGEKLDTLVGKSDDLSMASQMFYKQARKTNSCCKLM